MFVESDIDAKNKTSSCREFKTTTNRHVALNLPSSLHLFPVPPFCSPSLNLSKSKKLGFSFKDSRIDDGFLL